MALGSTYVLGLSTGSKTLNKVNQSEPYAAEYFLREAAASYKVLIRHSQVKRENDLGEKQTHDHHNVEVTIVTFATPTTPEYKMKTWTSWESPTWADCTVLVDAQADWLIITSNENVVQMNSWRS